MSTSHSNVVIRPGSGASEEAPPLYAPPTPPGGVGVLPGYVAGTEVGNQSSSAAPLQIQAHLDVLTSPNIADKEEALDRIKDYVNNLPPFTGSQERGQILVALSNPAVLGALNEEELCKAIRIIWRNSVPVDYAKDSPHRRKGSVHIPEQLKTIDKQGQRDLLSKDHRLNLIRNLVNFVAGNPPPKLAHKSTDHIQRFLKYNIQTIDALLSDNEFADLSKMMTNALQRFHEISRAGEERDPLTGQRIVSHLETLQALSDNHMEILLGLSRYLRLRPSPGTTQPSSVQHNLRNQVS